MAVPPAAWQPNGIPPAARREAHFACPACHTIYSVLNGLPCLMVEGDLWEAEPFLEHYEKVREGEGLAFPLDTVRALPDLPPDTCTRSLTALWRRRRDAYDRLLAILRIRTSLEGDTLNILELGAGTGWLSSCLHALGYQVVATDICRSHRHGLGMASQLANSPGAGGRESSFLCIQASMERLPFVDQQFDVVVAAASLHYARSVTRAVREAARVLAPGGAIMLVDTPLYETASGGEAVVARHLAEQRERFGSDGARAVGPCFLVRADLRRTFALAGLRYQEIPVHGPFRAAGGGARRWIRRAFHRPDLAIMPLVLGEKEGGRC
jgi:SAM-dependent methyltransferase